LPSVLVVGVRSPVALELIRQLHFHGLDVEGADFLHFPLGRFSCRLKRYHRLPSPRRNPAEFRRRLTAMPQSTVFACNEEIFWCSSVRSGVWDRLEKLEQLHRKDRFVELLSQLGLPAPETTPLENWAGDPREIVLKQVYSRFGESTWVQPGREQVEELRRQPGWLAQQRLDGPQTCFAGFAWQGRLICGCCYRSRWGSLRGARHGGAGLYFEKCSQPELVAQAERLVSHLEFSGPLGLDFVGGVAIECNPRWTSGIHLLDLTPVFAALGLPTRPGWRTRERAQLAVPMLLRASLSGSFWRDWWSATDVIGVAPDWGPALAQPLALAESLWWAARRGISLSQAMTWDMEWNGAEDVAAV
jgi:hypothetical protein